MINYYLTKNGALELIDAPEKNCWINLINPNEDELNEIASLYQIEDDDIRAALDEEEASRITVEDQYTIILIDIPTIENRSGKNRFATIPLAIIVTSDALITVCLQDTSILSFPLKVIKTTDTRFKTRLLLTILLENAKMYLKNLRQINKQSEKVEIELHSSIENSALLEMMELGRSLLYFSTSLKANSVVLEKLTKTQSIKKYPEDDDLLEDVIIENRQASEMADTYSGVINGTMDAYSSIISNNMNVAQKFIATASVVIAVPSVIFDAFGMNLKTDLVPFFRDDNAFIVVVGVALIAGLLVLQYFRHKKKY